MRNARKKPVWPWTVALLVGLPVLYVASFGPACWMMKRGSLPIFPTAYPYWPLVVSANAAPRPVRSLIGWYSGNSPMGWKNMLFDLTWRYIDRERELGIRMTPLPPQ